MPGFTGCYPGYIGDIGNFLYRGPGGSSWRNKGTAVVGARTDAWSVIIEMFHEPWMAVPSSPCRVGRSVSGTLFFRPPDSQADCGKP